MSDTPPPPPTIDSLKAQASSLLPLDDPLLAYKKFFRGREAEYSYREFLDEFCKPEPEAEEDETDEEQEDELNVND